MDDGGIKKKRQNVIGISLALIFINGLDIPLSELKIFGIDMNLDHSNALFILWSLFIYFIARYISEWRSCNEKIKYLENRREIYWRMISYYIWEGLEISERAIKVKEEFYRQLLTHKFEKWDFRFNIENVNEKARIQLSSNFKRTIQLKSNIFYWKNSKYTLELGVPFVLAMITVLIGVGLPLLKILFMTLSVLINQ